MFLLNLSLMEFLAVFGAISAGVVTLYLLDRSRRRQVVATLRFWTASEKPSRLKHRRRIQQPLSLALQLLSILLLLLALAQLRLGSREAMSRDHVLILDTSAWMNARSGRGTLMDEARSAALSYLRSLPGSDRVMVVRANSLVTPATGFETDRRAAESAIRSSHPGSSALNLELALEFARQARRLNGERAGEVVVAGAARIAPGDAPDALGLPLRILRAGGEIENCGLRKIGLRRSEKDPDLWEIFVSVRNYGTRERSVPAMLLFGGAPAGSRLLRLKPGADQEATFHYRTRAAGWLDVRLMSNDSIPEDDRAELELPARPTLRVAVYTPQPDLLRPVLAASPLVEAQFYDPAAYSPGVKADIVILDRCRPGAAPAVETIWIQPPAGASPVPVRSVLKDVPLRQWHSGHALGNGLHTKDLRLEEAQIYAPQAGDIVVAEAEGGPVILARPGKPNVVALGFHPVRSAMRYELATPLLFANILRWMAPQIFRRWELNAGTVGAVYAPLPPEVVPGEVRVVSDDGKPVPFTLNSGGVRFFAGTPSTIRLRAGPREAVYSLTLPELAESRWEPPASARKGVPAAMPWRPASRDIWPWLAILGAAGLLLEWILFGRSRLYQPRLTGRRFSIRELRQRLQPRRLFRKAS